jgi:uncharacterized protein (DUF1330 family)
MPPLRFAELVDCDIFRDGGSYEATLRTPDGDQVTLALEVDRTRDERPRRHGSLYECALHQTRDARPVAIGSEREGEILAALDAFLAGTGVGASHDERLRELRAAIPRRTGTTNPGPPEPPLVAVATLTIIPGRQDAFHAYERKAAAIMARHGGTIVQAVHIPGEPEREVHVLRFPDAAAFAAYRADADLAALATLRASVISATLVLVGRPGERFD